MASALAGVMAAAVTAYQQWAATQDQHPGEEPGTSRKSA
jgi:hypothetical protein